MKSNFKLKLLCSTLALALLVTACGTGNTDGNAVNEGTEVESVVEGTEEVSVQEEESEIVGSTQLTEEEEEWQNYLVADVDVSLRVRKGPSTEEDIVGVLEKGARATIVEKGEEWTKIISGEVEGYVSNKYCLYGTDALNYVKETSNTVATSTTDLLNIRQEMNTESTVLAKFMEGTSLLVDHDVETEEGWVAVRYNGMTAYVSAEYVTLKQDIKEAITIEEVYAREKAAYEKAQAQSKPQSSTQGSSASSNTGTTTGSSSIYTTINSSIIVNASEYEVLAAMIWVESGNQSYECNLAVASVIMNRVRGNIFPNSVKEVVFQDGQFPPATGGQLENCLRYGKTTENCYKAAQAALNGEDNTDGCLYFNTYNGTREGLRIGAMVFWKTWK